MDFDASINSEKTSNVDIPPAYVGLRILLIDHDSNSLSNIATILEEYSFKVTAIEQATVALSILREHIDQFDLIMVDVNMPEIDYLDFIKSTQLIKDKPIICFEILRQAHGLIITQQKYTMDLLFEYDCSHLPPASSPLDPAERLSISLGELLVDATSYKRLIVMSPETTTKMVKEAIAEGAFIIYKKLLISSMRLKNVWRHVYRHNKKANKKSQHNEANHDVMDSTSCAMKLQDEKAKHIAKDEPERSKRMRNTSEETQVKSSGTSEKEEDLILKTSIGKPKKKRRCVQWTIDLDQKLDEVVSELGEKACPRHVLERMCVPDLTKKQLTYRLQNYRSQKQAAPNVQPANSMKFDEEHNFSGLNPSDSSANFDELFQGAYKPQPPEVPLIAAPSSEDYFLNAWNEWDELLELNAELMPENQSVTSYNSLDYIPIFGSPTQENVSTRSVSVKQKQ